MEAERHALAHRKRAMLIRRLRRLPEKMGFWLPPEVVHAIIHGPTPILMARDGKRRRSATVGA